MKSRSQSRPKRQKHDLRRIRRTVTYSIPEIVDLLGVHPNTVHAWFRDGLPKVDKCRPYLVHGADLYAYLKTKRERRKQRCGKGQMFCVRCRAARYVVPGTAQIEVRNVKRVIIKAVCLVCGTRMNRAGTTAKILEYAEEFAISSKAKHSIEGTAIPFDHCEKMMEAKNG